MITVRPVRRALVPTDSDAARRVSGPNYDEFQGDEEVFALLQSNPESILRVTMAHCDVPTKREILEGDSDAALSKATSNMRELVASSAMRVVPDVFFVYEIVDPLRPGTRQIGLGGMARTGEIRTESTPNGPIIRNEGVREPKARGRARLIEATSAYVGTVNNAVPDTGGELASTLEDHADSRAPHYEVGDEHGNTHRIWLVDDYREKRRFGRLLEAEPEAYVADGNHRSAAAAMLGYDEFLAVFFPMDRMGLGPYNRLVRSAGVTFGWVLAGLMRNFEVEELPGLATLQPERTHEIGLYREHTWYRLRPKPSAFDPGNAVESIDADIVQRKFFSEVLRMTDPGDARLTFVGANRDVRYLVGRVDSGDFEYAVTLPPVTMEQFAAVCRQNRIMPPKSTWFRPKIRSGLVIALLD